jgi:Ca2+-binding EF-hand superfamily protein
LDADQSGSVSIAEIVGFLNADVDVKALEAEFQRKQDLVERLKDAQGQLEKDLKIKTAAWKVDHSIRNVTAIKSLELDTTPPSIRTGEAFGEKRSKKPIERRVLERCRQRIRKAGEAEGKPLEEVLAKLDRDKSGALEVEEFHRALRVNLKIPGFAVSDSEIISLFSMLDQDKGGAVSISEILDFIGAAAGEEGALEPIKTVDSPSATQGPKPRKHGPRMSVTLLERTRARLNDAAYQAHPGRQLEEVFARFDKERTGRLPDADFRMALRRGLKMPSSILADHEIHALCGMLEPENTGAVDITKIVSFIGPEPVSRPRTSTGGTKLEPLSARESRPGTTT